MNVFGFSYVLKRTPLRGFRIIDKEVLCEDMSKQRRKEVAQVLKPHWKAILAIILIQAVAVFTQVNAIRMLKPILDKGVFDKDIQAVLSMGMVLLAMTLIILIALTIVSYIASKVATSVASELRVSIITAAMKSDRMDRMGESTTKTMTSLTADVNTFQHFLYESLRTYLPMPLLMVSLFYYTFKINFAVGVMMACVFSIITIITLSFGNRVYRLYPIQVEYTDRVNNRLREKITGYRTISAYNAKKYEQDKFLKASDELGAMTRKVSKNTYFIPNLTTAMIWISIIIIYMIASLDAYGRTISATSLLLFMQYTTYIVATLALIPYLSTEAPRAFNCFHRIQDMVSSVDNDFGLTEPDSVDEEADPLRFEEVTSTDRRGRRTVNDVTFTIRKGETVSIVGPNGCGASDLMDTALGFTTPEGGRISVSGVEIDRQTARYARGKIAHVGSMMSLLRGTLRYNLNPHRERSDKDVLEMCQRCGLNPFIQSLPEGLDTPIDINDSKMSGGQKQLVAIVRCLLRKSDIYVFDNCFFSLDQTTRQMVMDTIRDVCAGSTLVFCMHDVSTCPLSDRVVVMDKGRITAEGTPKELMESSAIYRSIACTTDGGESQWI